MPPTPPRSSDTPSSAAEKALVASPHAAWIVDIAAGRVVAANARGAERLGFVPRGTPQDREAAMPALTELRRLASLQRDMAATAHGLVFWTSHGATHMRCRVRWLTGGDSDLALIEADVAPEARATSEQVGSAGATDTSSQRDDAETLREIARRIREGQKAMSAGGALPPAASSEPSRPPDPTKPRAKPALPPRHNSLKRPGTDAAGPTPPAVTARTAHELKTPIGAIAAAAEIMRDESLGPMGNERYRGYAGDIVVNAHHALAVIDRMMGMSNSTTRPPGGTDAPRAIDVNELCTGIISGLLPLAHRAGIDLAAKLEPRLPLIKADATSLKQMVLNLVTNAMKFTPAGGRVLIATAKGHRGTVRIEVRDTGPGMTRAEIARALNATAATSGSPRPGGGLGLGLPLVRALAEANAGTLDVRSVLEKGTVAGLTFPAYGTVAR